MTIFSAALQNKLDKELKRQRAKIEDIKEKTIGEFQKDHRDLTKEMDNRFEQQDRVIKNITYFIQKQIQLW